MDFVTQKIKELPSSGIRKFFDIAASMKDIVSLGVGEPDFYTPWNVREEAVFHIEKRRTTYTSNAGVLPLREEIARYTERKYGMRYCPEKQILVTVGGSEAIDLALRACIDAGDEVLYHEPCFVSYMPCVRLAGGVPVPITTRAEDKFKLTAQALEAAITPKTKALMLSYPNNPTGAVMTKNELEALCAVLRKHKILIISDEIYSELTYLDEPHTSIASLSGMYERTVYISGFSKAFAMTGWRMGYACGPADIIAAMTKIHQFAIMCAPTIEQHAAITALRDGDSFVAATLIEYDARRRLILEGLRSMGLECFTPEGAFYVFPSIKKTGLTTDDFCTRLLTEKRLAVVPGHAFGACGDGFIRCSYAYSIDNIKAALERLEAFVRGL